nr:hypothetical protein [uncultured Pseudomonas sp.]
MNDPIDQDPYIDDDTRNPGEPAPEPKQAPSQPAPEWPEGQVPPEEQSDG